MFNYSLFARPGFLSGMSRVLDISGTLNQYNCSGTPEEADRKAIMSDWGAVGLDLQEIIDNYEKFSKDKKRQK
ncbi:conserved hypothetical protein [Desulfamplus magnetovallimortis]|uniref:Uncharacterized protein n=1 Tax=Desulfamplus magnetovallimortis TaxID=1246637 RepID=A0A1W1HHL6_9BACT|nr:hypothetical protein [Desulfamplus magnetovallimortis]SLM31923.1 conserved hypothetical protein [Desulfamplus magnetovallimortis]